MPDFDDEAALTEELFEALAPRTLTDLSSRILADIGSLVSPPGGVMAEANFINMGYARGGPANWPRLPTVGEGSHNLRVGSWQGVSEIDMDMPRSHPTRHMNADEVAQDETHQNVVRRWAEGSATPAEIELMQGNNSIACPCRSCIQSAYSEVQRNVGPTPSGYSETCTCLQCRWWRAGMARGIQAVIVGHVQPMPVQTYNLRIDEVARPVFREVEFRIEERGTIFERARASRGHPVPKQALALDWQPNKWEA